MQLKPECLVFHGRKAWTVVILSDRSSTRHSGFFVESGNGQNDLPPAKRSSTSAVACGQHE